MPAQITVKYPDAKLKKLERMFREFPKDLERVMPRAINRTMRTSRAQAARLIKADTPKLRVGDIKRKLFENKATRAHWRSKLSLSARPISLRHFALSQTKVGVPIKIQSGRQIVKRAFRMGPANSVFVRNPVGESLAWFDWRAGSVDDVEALEPRLPITKLLGPSMTDLYGEAPGVVSRVTGDAGKTLNKNIDDAVDYAMIRRMPK